MDRLRLFSLLVGVSMMGLTACGGGPWPEAKAAANAVCACDNVACAEKAASEASNLTLKSGEYGLAVHSRETVANAAGLAWKHLMLQVKDCVAKQHAKALAKKKAAERFAKEQAEAKAKAEAEAKAKAEAEAKAKAEAEAKAKAEGNPGAKQPSAQPTGKPKPAAAKPAPASPAKPSKK